MKLRNFSKLAIQISLKAALLLAVGFVMQSDAGFGDQAQAAVGYSGPTTYGYVEDMDGEDYFSMVKGLAAKAGSIDRFLESLPDHLKNQHALMFDSKSVQEASYLRPRVLIFSPAAMIVMSFNGEPSQKGYEVLETIRFTRTEGRPRFILEEIVFAEDLGRRESYLRSVNEAAQLKALIDRANRQGPNPPLCLGCHRQDPRPNWESYPFWPGAYGQFDDRPFQPKGDGGARVLHPQTLKVINPSTFNDQAEKHLPQFLAEASELPRYRHLIGLDEHMKLEASMGDPVVDGTRTQASFLATLTARLSWLNLERVARIISESRRPGLNAIRWLYTAQRCNQDRSDPVFKEINIFGYAHVGNNVVWPYLKDFVFDKDVPWRDLSMSFVPNKLVTMTTPGNFDDEVVVSLQNSPAWQQMLDDLQRLIPTDEQLYVTRMAFAGRFPKGRMGHTGCPTMQRALDALTTDAFGQ